MSAANFHNRNASKIFAYEGEEDFEYDDLKENVKSAMENITGWSFTESGSDDHELRSYPSSVIGSLSNSKSYKDFTVEVMITAIIRSGYYSGCNLDWQVDFYFSGECMGEEIDNEWLMEQVRWECRYPKSKAQKYADMVEKWMYKAKDALVNHMEKIFGDYTDKYICLGAASNGEAFYRKVN